MPIALDSINVRGGEEILVHTNSSSELCFLIRVLKNRRTFVTGPFNSNENTFELTTSGMVRITKPAFEKLIAADSVQPK